MALVPQTVVVPEYNQDWSITNNQGSFQGFTSGTQVVTLERGHGVASIVHTSTGVYTVTLQFIPGEAILGGTANTGLVSEPFAYVVSETAATLPASNFVVYCTRVSTTGTFTIQTFTQSVTGISGTTGTLTNTAADVTSADRVFFQYAYKSFSGYGP